MPKCVSPLRYPGGKAKLYKYVSGLMAKNFTEKPVYCEPFAGGFGLGISLLLNGDASRVIINDFDFCIFAFWKCVTDKTLCERLINKIRTTDITIEEWKKQREIYRDYKKYSVFQVGFATFFLNRCNRSGILMANPIGGINQTGNYAIDCRFNKENLIKLIEQIHAESDRIDVYNIDAVDLIDKVDTSQENVLFNIDPPYINAGPLLYKNTFSKKDHSRLADRVKRLNKKWIMTYDDVPLVKKLYENCTIVEYELLYSLENKCKAKELMIFCSDLKL